MPLKDHKRELEAVSEIATLLKFAAIQKLEAQGRIGLAIKAVAQKRKFEEEQAVVKETIGTTWGAW